ncbi:TetR/AcrR family transcriptional regulator [Patulibacter minatonensis]|uniref:TetR/AcrR family transcriptional regulator n=1 Tax=Patulibacter minatonensis TaxID=298163 RepID=UPI00047CAE42|nr:TetR/AcrR family transcriptional regulator [Patulibacter minatonensis]
MSSPAETPQRPMRADARRNYDKLVAAAREAFTEDGAASLEEVARRAGVGSATLHRNFPTRQHLLETVYLEEVEAMSRTEGLDGLGPWDALETWLRRFAAYAVTKRAIGDALVEYMDRDSEVFQRCAGVLIDSGEPLLQRAQEAGEARPDATFIDVAKMIGGIAGIRTADAEQTERILSLALDGLRTR